MKVLLVDPSLYTPPYDAALMRGLLAIGVQPVLATRPLRAGERQDIPADCTDAFFYRRTDRADGLPPPLRLLLKGCAHIAGTLRLIGKVRRERPDVVHVLWLVLPPVDLVAMALIRRWCPVVLTVHDTVAYNGQKLAWPQQLAHDRSMKLAHQVIVHTRSGRQRLVRRGLPDARVSVIPHGPLGLPLFAAAATARDPRWTAVLFGELKPYKGLDLLIEAVGALPAPCRRQLRVVVAGRPRMDMAPLIARILALGVSEQFELRLARLSEEQMAALFAEADAFVFPYRQIDASGVYYLVNSLGKWLIASRVGIFAEDDISGAGRGALVPPEDVPALGRALQHAIETRPSGRAGTVHPWSDIAHATRALYERAMTDFDSRLAGRARKAWQR
jgi:glycosyltransferase involved in cell wall biosynthesis